MNYQQVYELWKNAPHLEEDLKLELDSLTDEADIEDRFYQNLAFGTAGMRGKIGAGTNRMNTYVVARATLGFANYLKSLGGDHAERGLAIAYDSRNKSTEFAKVAAGVLAAHGVKAYIFDGLRPTPELSFAVRDLQVAGGIIITASHNPKVYNGYKVYGPDGAQLASESGDALVAEIEKITAYFDIDLGDYDALVAAGKIVVLGETMDNKFYGAVEAVAGKNPNPDFKVIYTPLHGTGNIPVRRVLADLGYENVVVVPEQELPDGDFTTVEYPNPEEKSVFNIAMEMAKTEEPDIILGTDPDCDRVGVVVKDAQGEYLVFTGNQTGALLVDYYLKSRTDLPDNKVVIKSIVTSELGGVVARANGAEVMDVLTGFKYIGDKMTEFEETGEHTFAFGYEESYGYLAGTYARDKDGVVASALICEMAAYYKKQGMTLYDALQALYQEYGYYIESIEAFTLEGIEGKKKIEAIMEKFRASYFTAFADAQLAEFDDFLISEAVDESTGTKTAIDLPKSNVLKFKFNENSWYALRPSGTEPKLKIYFSVTGKDKKKAEEKMAVLKKAVDDIVAQV